MKVLVVPRFPYTTIWVTFAMGVCPNCFISCRSCMLLRFRLNMILTFVHLLLQMGAHLSCTRQNLSHCSPPKTNINSNHQLLIPYSKHPTAQIVPSFLLPNLTGCNKGATCLPCCNLQLKATCSLWGNQTTACFQSFQRYHGKQMLTFLPRHPSDLYGGQSFGEPDISRFTKFNSMTDDTVMLS